VLTVKVKKKCCRSTPRCRSCPVLALQKAREKAERKAAKKAAKKERKLARAHG
jgi:adenine-specific DNA glycosylase